MTEIEQFESWWATMLEAPYCYDHIQKTIAWNAWQAARAQPAQAVPITSESGNQAAQGASGITSQAVPVLTEAELRSILQGTNHMVKNAMHGAFWPELEEACRAIEQAVRAKMGVAVPMTAAGQMFAEAKKAVGVTFRVNPNLDAETVRQAHVAVSEAPPYELPDWQKAALCVCREVVTAWGSEESRAAHGIVGKEGE